MSAARCDGLRKDASPIGTGEGGGNWGAAHPLKVPYGRRDVTLRPHTADTTVKLPCLGTPFFHKNRVAARLAQMSNVLIYHIKITKPAHTHIHIHTLTPTNTHTHTHLWQCLPSVKMARMASTNIRSGTELPSLSPMDRYVLRS